MDNVKVIKLELTGDPEKDREALAATLKDHPAFARSAHLQKLSQELKAAGWEHERCCSVIQAQQLMDSYDQNMGFVLGHLAQEHGVLQAALVGKELFGLLHSAVSILGEAAFALRQSFIDPSVEPIIRGNRDRFAALYADMKAREDLAAEVNGHG